MKGSEDYWVPPGTLAALLKGVGEGTESSKIKKDQVVGMRTIVLYNSINSIRGKNISEEGQLKAYVHF